MLYVHVITNGGVWFCESREYLQYHIGAIPDSEAKRMREINKTTPMHCVIGNSGYTQGHGAWPKDGLYCEECGTIAIKTKST